MTRLVVLVLAGALALVAAGCGGDSDEGASGDLVAWADTLCSSYTTWTDDLERIGSELSDVASLSADSLRQAGDDLGEATQTFVEQISLIGRPDTESGDEALDLLDSLSATIEREKQEIDEAIDTASGIAGLASAASTVASSLTAMAQEFQRTFDELDEIDAEGEFEQAFQESDACAEVRSD